MNTHNEQLLKKHMPDIVRQLAATLRRKHVPRQERSDVAQDCLLRLVRRLSSGTVADIAQLNRHLHYSIADELRQRAKDHSRLTIVVSQVLADSITTDDSLAIGLVDYADECEVSAAA